MLEFSNALFSSPFASSPWRSATVVLPPRFPSSRSGRPPPRDGSDIAAEAGGALDCAFDRGHVLVQACRQLIERVLRLLPGRGIGLAQPFQVGRDRLRCRLRIVGGRRGPLFVGSLFREPAADFTAVCQVASDVENARPFFCRRRAGGCRRRPCCRRSSSRPPRGAPAKRCQRSESSVPRWVCRRGPAPPVPAR